MSINPESLSCCLQLRQVFGNSPDETAYCQMLLNRETVGDGLTMIQPSMLAYTFGVEPEPVLLDVSSIMPDRILLLDSYFYIVIFHGSTIAQWRRADYQSQEEHAAFAELLQVWEAPKAASRQLLGSFVLGLERGR